jgi:carbonic anhydrase/acetyltransferase-like protein (isoleucine patch superfamily)
VIALDLMWWVGWAYFAACVALPVALVRYLGPVAGAVAWALLAPWSALLGMAIAHRLLPPIQEGVFRPFADRGSVRWALKGWAPAVYLTVFQPVFFLSPRFQRIALRAFGARLAHGAWVTSRTILHEPHLVTIGRDSVVGEYAHLACSFQPRVGTLIVAGIHVGDDVLIGAHAVLGAGCRVGDRSVIEYRASVGAHASIGEDARVGAVTFIGNRVRIGRGVRIGKGCLIRTGAVIQDGARLADGTVWPVASASAGTQRSDGIASPELPPSEPAGALR